MDLCELELDGMRSELIHKGQKASLIAYLRSNKPLRPPDREHLADYLEGKKKAEK